ncbi:MAG: hypothetical protein KGJ23_00475 [Euryarchaeota archaeon]|nr:hypothetical protein [Euryarchaeota archaeon]MDE2044967.1 hypothetical protein [Thermoplasmata archaeon]
MRLATTLVHSPKDRHVPRALVLPERRPAHRPHRTFRLRIRTIEDAREAGRAGLPVHAIPPEVTAAWGFPRSGGTWLVVAKGLVGLVGTSFPVLALRSEEAARRPTLEDLVVVLLMREPLLARALAMRHRKFLHPDRLLKRILQEDQERSATLVGLQELVPGLPRVGESLPRSSLELQDRNAWVGGRL